MKKLMFAALAVAGMSAVAADFAPVAIEKVQFSLKQVNAAKVDSVKYNGFIFWGANAGEMKAVVWDKNSKAMIQTNCTEKAFGKDVKIKKVYQTVDLGDFEARIDSGDKKQGKAIAFGNGYLGYGSGSALISADLVKGDITKIKESISGNMVNVNKTDKDKDKDGQMYGTWKLSFDKSTSKKLDGKTITIKDVLVKNKVEFWDL